ncbi:hypothetical protein LCGC14_0877920 [marine sediment metagenome]|uniref:Uncharacterized protein n=1 Tax=marine sediment metagenome TaxID=412755 RepID=A0A0F9P2Q6_9ZZZZ
MKLTRGFRIGLVALAVLAVGLLLPTVGVWALPIAIGASETTTTALIDEAMKVIFAKSLHNDIVADSELMDAFKTEMNIKTEETTGGRYVEQGHFWTLPAGAGWRLDDEYIPEAVSATFKNSRIYLKKFLLTLQMSGDTMRRVRTDEGAFLDYMDRARPALVERANQELDSAYIGFGSGIKARVATGGVTDNGDGTMTFGVVDHSGVSGFSDAWLQFLEGERVVFSDTAGFTALRFPTTQSAKVTDLDEDAATVTVSAAAGLIAVVAAGDYIATGDEAGHSGQSSGTDRALSGIMAGIDDGNILQTYNNIDRLATGNRLWRSIVIDATTNFEGVLSEECLNFACRTTLIRGNGKPDMLIMSHSARDSYWKSIKGDRFFIDPGGNYTGGKGKLQIVLGDRVYPLRVARKLPPEVCFGVQKDRFARLTLGELTWEEETGSMWNRVTDSTGRKDSYYSVAHMYEQLYNAAPRKSFRIDGLIPVI